MNQHEMPSVPPKPGEVWLSVELTALGEMPIAEALRILQEMGYEPSLRYQQQSGEIRLFALLKHEQHDDQFPGDDYLGKELDALAEKIPTHAISSPRRLRYAIAA